MHKKHRLSIVGLFLATSVALPSSLTVLRAKEAVKSEPAHGIHAMGELPGTSEGSTKANKLSARQRNMKDGSFFIAVGRASYYANWFHGRKTASGEHFDRRDYTAAHRSLPFGTRVRVTNLENGRHVFVKINDRGPHIRNRIIDISQAAAKEIGLVDDGVGNVKIEAYN
jgi:rare lipoprotein A